MKTLRRFSLLLASAMLSCTGVGSRSTLETTIQNANSETLKVALEEHSDGTASYVVRAPSGLVWKIPTMGYAPGRSGVDGAKQRDYYYVSQLSAADGSVVALQEQGESGNNGLFVARGRMGTLYLIEGLWRVRTHHSIPDATRLWYQSAITRLSMRGMVMAGVPLKWSDISSRKVYEGNAVDITNLD